MSDDLTGRALDAAVAERVMGWTGVDKALDDWTGIRDGNTWCVVPPYSTDLAAAWEVVERLRLSVIPLEDGRWLAGQFGRLTYISEDLGVVDGRFEEGAAAASASEAICRAALKAVG